MNLLSRLYALVLRLYPPAFRREFAEEMQEVFDQALRDAGQQGRLSSARLFLREMTALPPGLLQQFWSDFSAWIAQPWQDPTSLDLENSRPGSWLSAGLAGLPHLLYALALYLPLLVTLTLGLPNYHGPSLPVFWGMVAVALFVARRHAWPRWSSSWIGYGLVFILDQASFLVPSGPLALLAGVVWLSLAALLLFCLARRDWMSGLLAILPISPMWIWLSWLDGPPGLLDLAALYLSISLMLSLAVFTIVRLGHWRTALLLILAVTLATGMPDSYGLSPRGGSGSWLANYTVILLFTAPLWLMALWRQVQRRQAARPD